VIPLISLVFGSTTQERAIVMLYVVAAVIVDLWIIGLATSFTMNGLIHILLVIAIAVLLVRVNQLHKII
jgi:hypothetical protein